MKSITFLILTLLLPFSAVAQDSTAAKIDTLLINQKALMELQQQMYKEAMHVPPLANKSVGIELNLARILASSADDFFTLTGTFSLFAVSRKAEIAFPFFYQTGNSTRTEFLGDTEYDVPLTVINLDATYRHFLGKYQDGFYFSTGMRYTYIKGVEGDDFFFSPSPGDPITTTHRAGAYFGLGYRYFTESGFYWGMSVIYGRYFGGQRDYQEVLLDDQKIIIDAELLKFGFAF